jgi:serine O-acetyltransferase
VNSSLLSLRATSQAALGRYVTHQLDTMFPTEESFKNSDVLSDAIGPALKRIEPIIAAVRNFHIDRFDHFHSLQYTIFLYLLGRQIFSMQPNSEFIDRIFCLNRCLNSIDLHPSVEMPEVFFISHGLSSVIGNAQFLGRIVIFQNVTIGRLGQNRPSLGSNVILFPGSSVTGTSTIGDNCVIGAAVPIHNVDIPQNSIVKMRDGELSIEKLKRDYSSLYFR